MEALLLRPVVETELVLRGERSASGRIWQDTAICGIGRKDQYVWRNQRREHEVDSTLAGRPIDLYLAIVGPR